MIRALCILLLLAMAPGTTPVESAHAQVGGTMPEEFDSGDENFQFHAYVKFLGVGPAAANLFAGQGLSGISFKERPDGGPSWFAQFEAQGFTTLTIDWPGTGRAPEPINGDLMRALAAHVTAAFDTGRGSAARLSIAHAEAAALLIKARSFSGHVSRTAVLIDPIGPQHAQPLEPMTFDQALAARATAEDELWRRLGFGPRAGVLAEGLDIDLATATAVFEGYERDCFPIRPALLQPLISPIRVRGASRLAGWPVLVLRTPAADARQIAREEALSAWLREAGARVETLDLGADPAFAGVTGLPWIGEKAPAVLELVIEWYRRNILFAPEPEPVLRPGS